MKRTTYMKYTGFLGFLGFLGFEYFQNNDISTLSYFAFFAFFSHFWLNKITSDMVDERYVRNSKNAKAFTFNIAVTEFIILYIITPLDFTSKEILTVISALFFASLILTYAIAFYKFEKM